MRLTRLRAHVKSPSERERRRISVGKFVYFAVLAGAALWLARYGTDRALHVGGVGFVRAERVEVQALTRGRVVDLSVALGDEVTRGQVLARLQGVGRTTPRPSARLPGKDEVTQLKARAADERREEARRGRRQVEELEARKARVERDLARMELQARTDAAALDTSRTEADRWKRLYELEAIPLETYLKHLPPPTVSETSNPDRAYLEAERTRLGRELARAREAAARPRARVETRVRLAQARATLETGPLPGSVPLPAVPTQQLRSPISGTVSEVYRHVGEVLLPGEVLAEVLDPTRVFVEAYFPPGAEGRLSPGTRVDLAFASGFEGRGQITTLDPAVTEIPAPYQRRYEPVQEGLRVRIRIDEPRPYDRVLGAKVRVRVRRF